MSPLLVLSSGGERNERGKKRGGKGRRKRNTATSRWIIILAYTSETIRRRLHRHFRLSIPTLCPYPHTPARVDAWPKAGQRNHDKMSLRWRGEGRCACNCPKTVNHSAETENLWRAKIRAYTRFLSIKEEIKWWTTKRKYFLAHYYLQVK